MVKLALGLELFTPPSGGAGATGPTIILSANTIAEASSIGTTVGVLSVIGATGTPVFSLTDSAGGKFAISGSNLNAAAVPDYETAATHSIIVSVTGMTPTVPNRGFTIFVVDVVEAIQLSSSTVAEDAAINVVVGTLSAAGTTGSPVFSLVDSAGGKFNISGSSLRVNAALDYEAASSHNIIVGVTGVTPSLSNMPFTITVTNVVETTGIVLSNNSVAEDAVALTVVGSFSVVGSTGTPVFSLTDNAGGKFNISLGNLRVNAALDYETAASHTIVVHVTGVTPPIADTSFTINVTDISEDTSVLLSSASVAENSAINTVIGSFSIVGATGSPVYTLLDSAGSRFNISGANLRVNAALDYEAIASHNIIVGVTGVAPAIVDTSFVITVTNVLEAIQLSNSIIAEDAAINTTVGTLSVVGVTGTPVFTLVNSAGGKFNISGTSLRVNAALDFELAAAHNIAVGVSGVTPAIANTNFGITVTDVSESGLPDVILAITSTEGDNTPDFELTDVPLALAVAGNKAQVQIDDNSSAFASLETTYNYTVTSGDELDLTLTITGATALTDGNKWARGRMLSSSDVPTTDWSNTVTFVIDAVVSAPPALKFNVAGNSMYVPLAFQ